MHELPKFLKKYVAKTNEELRERDTAMKPNTNSLDGDVVFYTCPNCREVVMKHYKFCSHCGQKLKWGEIC